jgi:hypothetical protein
VTGEIEVRGARGVGKSKGGTERAAKREGKRVVTSAKREGKQVVTSRAKARTLRAAKEVVKRRVMSRGEQAKQAFLAFFSLYRLLPLGAEVLVLMAITIAKTVTKERQEEGHAAVAAGLGAMWKQVKRQVG